jgi:hypothetical protein
MELRLLADKVASSVFARKSRIYMCARFLHLPCRLAPAREPPGGCGIRLIRSYVGLGLNGITNTRQD